MKVFETVTFFFSPLSLSVGSPAVPAHTKAATVPFLQGPRLNEICRKRGPSNEGSNSQWPVPSGRSSCGSPSLAPPSSRRRQRPLPGLFRVLGLAAGPRPRPSTHKGIPRPGGELFGCDRRPRRPPAGFKSKSPGSPNPRRLANFPRPECPGRTSPLPFFSHRFALARRALHSPARRSSRGLTRG